MLATGKVIESLEQLRPLGAHQFWPDDVSLLDPFLFRRSGLQRPHQITDSYLLRLAAAHGGKLATLDTRMSKAGVYDGDRALFLIAS